MKFPSLLTIATTLSLALLGGVDLAAALPIPNASAKPGFWGGGRTTNFDGKFNGDRLYDASHNNAWLGNESYMNTEAVMEAESGRFRQPRRKSGGKSFLDTFIAAMAPMQKTNLFWKRGEDKLEKYKKKGRDGRKAKKDAVNARK